MSLFTLVINLKTRFMPVVHVNMFIFGTRISGQKMFLLLRVSRKIELEVAVA